MQGRWRAIGTLLVFVLAFALVPAVVMAQGISGTAVDSVTGFAIPFASYQAHDTSSSPVADVTAKSGWNGKISVPTTVSVFEVLAYAPTHESTDTWSPGSSNFLSTGATVTAGGTTTLNMKMVRHYQPVYRFYNKKAGTHFYSANDQEFMNVYGNMAKTYSYDGVAYVLPVAKGTNVPLNNQPLWRFYNVKNGTHFYTRDAAEKASVMTNARYRYEGVAYNVSATMTEVENFSAVYRYYNASKNYHFYTMNQYEIYGVTQLAAAYKLEGIGFWIDQYHGWDN